MSVIIPSNPFRDEIQKPWVIDIPVNQIPGTDKIETKTEQKPKTVYVLQKKGLDRVWVYSH